MSVIAQGVMSAPVEKLRKMVALSKTFQQQRELNNHTEALDYVFTRDQYASKNRPFGICQVGEQLSFVKYAGGDQNYLRPKGNVNLYLCLDIPTNLREDVILSETYAGNFFGGVIADIVELSGRDDPESHTSHLTIVEADLQVFGGTSKEQWASLGCFYFADISFMWE